MQPYGRGNCHTIGEIEYIHHQPILLGTDNWVVERAPIEGSLHQKNKLDTLGFDERESRCKIRKN
jgi:hypothetical protein